MRLAHIMAGSPTGGAELFFERLTIAQHRAGDTVLPIIRRNPARAATLQRTGLTPVELPFGGPFDLLTPPRIAKRLRAFAPSLVMAWMSRAAVKTPKGPYTLAGRLGGYYDLRRFRHMDHLVANTAGLVRWIEGQGWPPGRVHHLPNFAPDLAGGSPAPLPVPNGVPVILALGRLHQNKAFDILIRALRHIPAAHLVIAGIGPEQDALLRLARTETVANRLHLLGWRTDQTALLAAATVLACPSRQEPLGNVILEAFSARIPVAASAIGGPAELIRDGETGLLVPPEDPAALAAALTTLIEDQARSTRIATAARAEYDAHHAEAPVLAQWRTTLAKLEPV